MIAVPVVPPVTIPVLPPIVAVVLVVVQLPPGLASLSVAVRLSHTVAAPVIIAGNGFTFTVVVVTQPVGGR